MEIANDSEYWPGASLSGPRTRCISVSTIVKMKTTHRVLDVTRNGTVESALLNLSRNERAEPCREDCEITGSILIPQDLKQGSDDIHERSGDFHLGIRLERFEISGRQLHASNCMSAGFQRSGGLREAGIHEKSLSPSRAMAKDYLRLSLKQAMMRTDAHGMESCGHRGKLNSCNSITFKILYIAF